MQLIDTPITIQELKTIAESRFGEMTKAVVDLEKLIMVVDAELHADQERFLIASGSKQNDLWGINLYPDFFGSDNFIEFDSMINIRPTWGNRSRGVEDEKNQKKIVEIVNSLITSGS